MSHGERTMRNPSEPRYPLHFPWLAGPCPTKSLRRISPKAAANLSLLLPVCFQLANPTEVAGPQKMALLDRDERWVRRLFERAVGGFFHVVLPPTDWHVSTGGALAWPTTAGTAGIGRILPGMRTDIVLDHKVAKRRIVIDTKFNAIVTSGWYREEIQADASGPCFRKPDAPTDLSG